MKGTVLSGKGGLSEIDVDLFRRRVLAWYDAHRRVLPWRAPEGVRFDPYRVWLSEIMLQQTVVAAVIPYYSAFLERWPDVQSLAAARLDDVLGAWAGLGYYSRARNLHKCSQVIVREHGGIFPETEKELMALPGVGAYTAAAILSIAFGRPSVVVDGNVERVMSRYFAITDPLPRSKPALRALAACLSEGREGRPGDYAQGLMDLGAGVCTPQSPSCFRCPLAEGCLARAKGLQGVIPYKEKKKEKEVRRGYVYWVEDEDTETIMVVRRPEKGLLGGMLAFPATDWLRQGERIEHLPAFKDLIDLHVPSYEIRHSFTHFHLELTGLVIKLGRGRIPSFEDGLWMEKSVLHGAGMPTVFRKFSDMML